MIEFPGGFRWGVSLSGFQFEMGDFYNRYIDTNTDWWHWVRDAHNVSSRLVSGDLPEDGVNYFGLYKVDHENAVWLGLNIYRIGVEWSRVFPHPTWFVEVDVEHEVSLDELDVFHNVRGDPVRVYENVESLVSRDLPTPLVMLKSLSNSRVRVWAKLEWYHPFSLSIKDR
ncbi:MAG: family 1 glycosylhydrolase, partial [Thermofilum sp.]